MPTIAFDFLGTLVQFDNVINAIWHTWEHAGLTHREDAVTLFEEWYQTSSMTYLAASHSGLYRSLLKILRGTLTSSVYKQLGRLPLEQEVELIINTFRTDLTPSPCSLEALQTALRNGWNVWIITQSDKMDTWNYLKKHNVICDDHGNGSNLDDDRVWIMACDELEVAKPHPKVYAQVMRLTVRRTQKIENFYMVSKHAWDLEGARNISMRTVYLSQQSSLYPTEVYDGKEPDLRGESPMECVNNVLHLEQSLKHHYLL
ncbi:HAD-like domain-containing protein [Halteromyces radiatus]|uniref:HAD-like domain-containing protein n=1 Tax=Halteromyces radiatus TaxID=101107 RepID=UPI002221062C|nr:HAD-like domain-containing protein [Halteromyces radiatus]KAI8086514.1 HAD-like domain-containing protein [Halteromyces radiatus]